MITGAARWLEAGGKPGVRLWRCDDGESGTGSPWRSLHAPGGVTAGKGGGVLEREKCGVTFHQLVVRWRLLKLIAAVQVDF